MRAWLLAALLLLAVPAFAQDSTVGTFTVNGQTFELILRPKQVTPPPPPPPPPPPARRSVYGVQFLDGTWTREARSGDVVTLRGEGLGTVPGLVTTAGIPADVVTWADTSLQIRIGRTDRSEVGGIRVAGEGWEVTAPFAFSVSPAVSPPPPPPPPPPAALPVTTGYAGSYGEPVKIVGTGFGTESGRVDQDGIAVEVLSWTDTEIVVTSRGSRAPMPGGFVVRRPDGSYVYGQAQPVFDPLLRP